MSSRAPSEIHQRVLGSHWGVRACTGVCFRAGPYIGRIHGKIYEPSSKIRASGACHRNTAESSSACTCTRQLLSFHLLKTRPARSRFLGGTRRKQRGRESFLSPCAKKTYADFPVFLTRESSLCQQPFRMPPFLFLDTSRYVIRTNIRAPHLMRISLSES